MINYKDIFLLENRFMILKRSSYDLHKSQLNGTWIEMLPPLRPVITITEDLQPFEATDETASDVQTYTIEATNLFGAIRVTAPNNYQLSIDGVNWRNSLALLAGDGVLSSTVYVRLNLGDVGTYNGNIRHVATGFNADVAVEGVIAAEVTTINYGLLYNWFATQDQGGYDIIPTAMAADGWGVPSDTDWASLSTYIQGLINAQLIQSEGVGDAIKEIGLIYWSSGNTANNEMEYYARGGGRRDYVNGTYANKNIEGFMSSLISLGTNNHFVAYLVRNLKTLTFFTTDVVGAQKRNGISIRILRPATIADGSTDGLISATYTGNDGKVYRCTKIGDQVWIADNLAETKWSNGNFIQGWDANGRVVIADAAWAALTDAAVCVYDNDINNL